MYSNLNISVNLNFKRKLNITLFKSRIQPILKYVSDVIL
jgi:hypothetical protein